MIAEAQGDSSVRHRRVVPIGAELQPEGGAHLRVWAPRARAVLAEVDGTGFDLDAEPGGYFSGFVGQARRQSRYGFQLDGGAQIYPDPASRFQPDGPHALSCIVDPADYDWGDAAWTGAAIAGQVVCELHVGTFTQEGSWRSAAEKLPLLADAGISLIEMMPVPEFPGRFGWGYDGVSLFAPAHIYGDPDDLRGFVDRAHRLGLGVILDVVYNHLGPDGNYLPCFSDTYFTDRHPNEWGDAVNFDGPGSAPVREFVEANAAYWIREFHFDGLRLDATQQMFDDSSDHIVASLTRAVRDAAGGRRTLVIAENETQQTAMLRSPERGGYGLDALWNDDFHHSAHVALTGTAEAYYSDYAGTARELLAGVKYGFLYQGQRSAWQSKRRGSPSLDVPAAQLVNFIENHDQVANSGKGARIGQLTDGGRLRAVTALLLLAPQTPMLFQGQEFGSSTPFLYFADHKPGLAEAVAAGRRDFLMQFTSLADVPTDAPGDEQTFRRCRLDWSERDTNPEALRLHRDLMRLRRADPVFAAQGAGGIDAAELGGEAFLVRFFGHHESDRLLLVNLGPDLSPPVFAEPLLAPPETGLWRLAWSSDDPIYGGNGVRHPEIDGRWSIPGHAAVVMTGR